MHRPQDKAHCEKASGEFRSDAKLAGFDTPGVAAAEKLGEIAGATLGLHVADLLIDDVFVAREIVPSAENADGSGETFAVLHV